MNDRVLTMAFGISLAVHCVLLVAQLVTFAWLGPPKHHAPLEVIYNYELAKQELRHLQQQLARAKRETVAMPSSSANLGERTQIRIPERSLVAVDEKLLDVMPSRSSVVDLTNLADAARGDPVLLSYFSAIREQIQQTANHQAWLTGSVGEGLVYVSFVLTSTGAVQEAAIVSDRSVPVDPLRDTALRIVKTAAPFPPFPPSMVERNKTIVVPLEFLLGGV